MCTMIAHSVAVEGFGKGADGWFALKQATVAYDHGTQTDGAYAVLLDFADYSKGASTRVGIELDLDSGRALLAQLQLALQEAELVGTAH